MAKESEGTIGLSELIEHVKRELLSTEGGRDGKPPLFSVDEVTLDLQVVARKQGNAGINLSVLQVGGSAGRDDVQRVSVRLTPLLGKDERIRLFKEQHPGRWQEVERASAQGTLRGGDL